MRNLKKILALALALIMSLSLMVTASAARTEFADQDSISENYALAVEVLNELGVLKGDANGFRPLDTITRGEVAAILYRIFTGRTEEPTADGHSIYTAAAGEFADVKGHWSEGYMVYAFQGSYIKGWPGVGGVVLNPGGDVTGYEVLTMILRAVGYDKKENEFTGLNWKINVATTATTLGVLANYQGADLGAPATRQEVAEMIFRAILLPKVEYNLVTNSYTQGDANNTIAASPLGLTKIEGVVTANEYADLDDSVTLPDGKTRILDAAGKSHTLNVSSDIYAIGENHVAYVQNGTTVLAELEKTGNNTWENDGASVSSVTTKARTEGVPTNDNTQYYINFGEGTTYSSTDWQISYELNLKELRASNPTRWGYLFWDARDNDLWPLTGGSSGTYKSTYIHNVSADGEIEARPTTDEDGNTTYDFIYIRTIHIDTEITQLDRDLIFWIFDNADKKTAATEAGSYVIGEVYVGTQSNHDISEDISFKEFWDTYVITGTDDVQFNSCKNGEWLKIVDNDGDGIAEYVFKTEYTLDRVVEVSDDGDVYYYVLDTDDYDDAYEPDGLEVDDVVVYCAIDGKVHIEKANSVTAVVETVSYKDTSITTDEPETYYQSGIANDTDMDEDITLMDEKTSYNIYFDKFGYARAYELAEGIKYGLLAEAYDEDEYKQQFVTRHTMTVELMRIGDADFTEYTVLNDSVNNRNPFWNSFVGNDWESVVVDSDENKLQRAISGLDLDYIPAAKNPTNYADHDEFEYSADGREDHSATTTDSGTHTWTNVAKYSESDDGVNLYTASQYMFNTKGQQLYYADLFNATGAFAPGVDGEYERYTRQQFIDALVDAGYTNATIAGGYITTGGTITGTAPAILGLHYVYAVDYVQLTTADIAKGQRHFVVNSDYINIATSNRYVDTTTSTVFFLVTPTGVRQVVGYANVPALDKEDDGIRAVYAVAKNTSDDNDSQDYWVADVVVIEMTSYATPFSSISLAYYNPSKTTGQVRLLDTLNNAADGVKLSVYPSRSTWPGTWDTADYGFWGLTNESERDDGVVDADITRIGPAGAAAYQNYNKYGIFAGTVIRTHGIDYIDVDLDGNKSVDEDWLDVKGVPIYTITQSSSTSPITANKVNRGQNVLDGHDIIWVLDPTGKDIAYIVITDVTNTPSWLSTIQGGIVGQQAAGSAAAGPFTVTVIAEDGTVLEQDKNVTAGSTWISTKTFTDYGTEYTMYSGYTFSSSAPALPSVKGTSRVASSTNIILKNVRENVIVTLTGTAKNDLTVDITNDDQQVTNVALAGVSVTMSSGAGSTTTTYNTTPALTFELNPGYQLVSVTVDGELLDLDDDVDYDADTGTYTVTLGPIKDDVTVDIVTEAIPDIIIKQDSVDYVVTTAKTKAEAKAMAEGHSYIFAEGISDDSTYGANSDPKNVIAFVFVLPDTADVTLSVYSEDNEYEPVYLETHQSVTAGRYFTCVDVIVGKANDPAGSGPLVDNGSIPVGIYKWYVKGGTTTLASGTFELILDPGT